MESKKDEKEKQRENEFIITEDEIDLFKLFEVIWKKKIVVLGCVIISMIISGVYLLLAKPLYRIEAQIKPFEIEIISETQIKLLKIISPHEIKQWFSKQMYKSYVKEKFGKTDIEIMASIPRGTSTVFLQMLYPDPEKGKEILMEVLNYYKNTIEKTPKFRELYNELFVELDTIKKEIRQMEDQKKYILKSISEISKEIELKYEKKLILEKQLEILKEKLPQKSENSLSYAFILLEENNIKKDLKETEIDIINLKLKIEELRQKLNNLEIAKQKLLAKEKKLEQKLTTFEPFYIVQPPVSSLRPVKPQKPLILMVTFIASLFLGIFLAFFLHALETRKKGNF